MAASSPAEVASHLWQLLEINRLITSSLDIAVVLETVTRQAAVLVHAEGAALWLRRGGKLKVAAAHRIPDQARSLEAEVGPGVMATIRDLGRASGLSGCVGVPLVLRGETIGVLSAYRSDATPATAEDEELLSALADQAAVALENAHIYRELQNRTEALVDEVNERRRVEGELRRSEAQFRDLIERLPDGVFIHREGHVTYANQALATLLGYPSPSSLVGQPVVDLYHPDDVPRVQDRISALKRGLKPPPIELRLLGRSGSFCEVETSAIEIHLEDKVGVVVIVHDLTGRKLVEREREEAYRRLRVIIDLAPVGIVLVDEAGRWDGNARAQQLFGRPIVPSADASQYEGDLLDASDKPLAPGDRPGARALGGQQLECVEMRLRRADGHHLPVLVSTAPIPAGEAAPPSAVIVFEDITPLKELERLRVEWSALVAHDLRQPINGIHLYTQIIAHEAEGNAELTQKVKLIGALAQRLSRMVHDLVDFTRLEARQLTLHRRSVDLVDVARQATELVALEAPDRAVELRIHGEHTCVKADADRIAQVMENLLTNAIKYGNPGTPIRVDIESGAKQVSVSVQNQGPGIAAEELPHLFGRFQRALDTKRRGAKGLGLGLYITRELVEAHAGQIAVESSPGGPTTFRFTLPRS